MDKTLHMIGHSHIDPVWFWTREEGMQEVRATIASALDRLDEFPDFHFTCTSSAFFAFLQEAQPAMLDRIRKRIDEGRFELAGGWWIEPDCNLPTGEAFVRQGLYGQRFLQKTFGRMARIGMNVDSFGHSPMLPQLLRGCGLEAYVFMRPSLTRPKDRVYIEDAKPVFQWQSPDGTTLPTISLPAEYTSWFDETTVRNINDTMSQLDGYPSLPCFFGVGNHGGGPTIANIHSVEAHRKDYPGVELRFSTLQAFFDDIQGMELPTYDTTFEHINTGCYSVDHRYKQQMRLAEQALLRAERLMAMAALSGHTQPTSWQAIEPLWQRVLFGQFHDTLGGTNVRESRENAIADFAGVTAQAQYIAQVAVQHISARVETRGNGHPLLLINDSPHPWAGVVDAELNWFCNDPLTLRDETGAEIPYQRTKQSCTMMWYRLGGRRRVLFHATVPPYGVRVLRAEATEPAQDPTPAHEADECVLENEYIRATFDERGLLAALYDKQTGHQALSGSVLPQIWADERDSWGNLCGSYHALPDAPVLEEMRVTERGLLRQTLRTRIRIGPCRMTTLYSLDAGAKSLRTDIHLLWDGPWQQLRLCLPVVGGESTRAEGSYCVLHRDTPDEPVYMHRYVDMADAQGRGLTVANDGIYAFCTTGDTLCLTLLRSAIYSHGNAVDWQKPYDTYEYTDIGEHRFAFLLSPHGAFRAPHEMTAMADALSAPLVFLQDCAHEAALSPAPGGHSFLSVAAANVRLGAIKREEDGDALILRLYETDGVATDTTLALPGGAFPITLTPWQVLTLRYEGETLLKTDMLERQIDG